jgi:hypothetical protein
MTEKRQSYTILELWDLRAEWINHFSKNNEGKQ